MADEEPIYSRIKQGIVQLGSTDSEETRRIRTDDEGRLRVVVEEGSTGTSENLLDSGSTGPIADNTPTTITTFTPSGSGVIRRIKVSGEAAADYQLRKNAQVIEIARTNLELDANFTFKDGLNYVNGDVFDVIVSHLSVGKLRSFDMFVFGE